MARKADPKWPSEAAMMADFQAKAKAVGFRVYPESCGHDLLLEATPEAVEELAHARPWSPSHPHYHASGLYQLGAHLEAGDVIALEGKLGGTFEVLEQAMPPHHLDTMWEPPDGYAAADFYGVVIPSSPPGFGAIARALGVLVIYMRPDGTSDGYRGTVPAHIPRIEVSAASRCVGYRRLPLPKIEVEMAGGQAAPRRITQQKIGAVEVCLIAQHRALVRKDFTSRGLRADSLVRSRWMRVTGRGAEARWTLTGLGTKRVEPDEDGRLWHRPLRPDLAYPEIADALRRSGFDPARSP